MHVFYIYRSLIFIFDIQETKQKTHKGRKTKKGSQVAHEPKKRALILKHCLWISLLSLFPVAYCGLYFTIRDTVIYDLGETIETTEETEDFVIPETIKPDTVYPDTVMVSSSGPAAELYPDSLGNYYLLPYPDISLNDLPVYKHSVRDDRFIVNMIMEYVDIDDWIVKLEHFWFTTREISNSGLREFMGVIKDGQMMEDRLNYNRFPNCKTKT